MAPHYLVTGAPGSGKSTVVAELLRLETSFVTFDIDWLAETAGELAGTSIYFDPAAGKPYLKLWFEVMNSVAKNGQIPLLFTPIDKRDVAEALGARAASVRWLLLDCTDEVREERLRRRENWTEERIREALEDGRLLRQEGIPRIDTGDKTPLEVARAVIRWMTEP